LNFLRENGFIKIYESLHFCDFRTAADDDSSEDENNKSARMILNEYDEGLNAVD